MWTECGLKNVARQDQSDVGPETSRTWTCIITNHHHLLVWKYVKYLHGTVVWNSMDDSYTLVLCDNMCSSTALHTVCQERVMFAVLLLAIPLQWWMVGDSL